MDICFPDYENSGLNVVSAILNAFGVKDGHTQQKDVKILLDSGKYKKAVLLLMDGMGLDILEKALPEDSYLRSHLVRELSAAYPSTTACATTSIGTCMTPREHGWLGWTLYFKEIDKLVDVLINRDEEGNEAAPYHVGGRYAPLRTVFPLFDAAGVKGHNVSRFGTDLIDDLDQMRDTVLRLCADDTPRFLYCYWGDPDHTMHEEGCYSPKVMRIMKDIDIRVKELADALPEDTLLIVTADHGLIDSRWIYMEDHPELTVMLERMPSVEPRAAVFYVKPEYRDAFPEAFRKLIGEDFILLTATEFVERGYLGGGKDHPKLYDFLGDYIALAVSDLCIGGRRGEHELKGVHAGLTRGEMRVPLIVAKK